MKRNQFFVLFTMILSLLLAFQISAMADNADLPDDLKEIGEEAFYGDQSITSLTIPDGAETIGARAFEYSGLEQIYIPASVTVIPSDAFDGVQNLTIVSPFDAPARAYAFEHQRIKWQGDVPITSLAFPDGNFRNVVRSYDSNADGTLSVAEIQVVTEITCDTQEIADLRGIEFFSALTSLNCQENQLASLDVSNNTALTVLRCYDNQLTNLDVSRNPDLERLDCHGNEISTLDISHNPELTFLNTHSLPLESLDVSHNPTLDTLVCFQNGLTALNVSNNPALTQLYCYENQLTSLDVSHNPALTTLSCYDNALTALDVSQNPALETLACSNNQITGIDVSHNQNLKELSCNNNSLLESVNVSNNSSLISLYCNSCPSLTNLNVQSCTSLELLSANGSGLTGLDVSNNRNLKILFCWRNNLTNLNLNQNNALVRVNLSANQNMNQLTLGQSPNLEMLWVQNTELPQINIGGSPIIIDAYRNGERAEFYPDGQEAPEGAGGFYGYMSGNGINSYSQAKLDHYNFKVDIDISENVIYTA